MFITTAQQIDGSLSAPDSLAGVIRRAEELSDSIAARPNVGSSDPPLPELKRCAELGLLTAPLSPAEGGLGLGTAPGTQLASLRVLAALGGGDLALGRIFEGHLNALLLLQTFGTPAQIARLSEECRNGALFGVWNTGTSDLLQLEPYGPGTYRFRGAKTFATAASFVQRPIVTAEIPGRGWQMCCPDMRALHASIDRAFWHPLGMESSESFGVDFTGCTIGESDLIGGPEDFYQDPLFRGGAIRFCAVQAGAALRLYKLFTHWLSTTGRGEDPYQIARLASIAIEAKQSVLWLEHAAAEAEICFWSGSSGLSARMIECANMTRVATERACTAIMHHVTVGVGGRGLLQPHRFERILRDLTMYLRQPAPDEALASIGRVSMKKVSNNSESQDDGLWTSAAADKRPAETLTPDYFHHVYQQNADPWNFETSAYEAAKYATTLGALPRPTYTRALEVGCSIGVLTQKLAGRCTDLVSVDVADQALAQARERCASLKNVTFEKLSIPQNEPAGDFDLIVVSEVAYYWSLTDLRHAIDLLAAHQLPGGHLLLVHWTPHVHDYPLTGDQVHDLWVKQPQYRLLHHRREEQFRLDLLERVA